MTNKETVPLIKMIVPMAMITVIIAFGLWLTAPISTAMMIVALGLQTLLSMLVVWLERRHGQKATDKENEPETHALPVETIGRLANRATTNAMAAAEVSHSVDILNPPHSRADFRAR